MGIDMKNGLVLFVAVCAIFGQPALAQAADNHAASAEAPPPNTQAEALASLNAHADSLAAKDRLSGAMLIETDGETVYLRHWGLADRGRDRTVTLATRFRLGSANKMFTAVAILQLVDRGRLALDGTVGQYLPDYTNRAIADHVTIRHLLTHTGGTGEIFTQAYETRRTMIRTHADYVDLFDERGSEFEPGSRSGYSNYGYVLLGRIIEQVTGESYYEYVGDNIFLPAGMTSTGSLPEIKDVPGRAVGYMRSENRWVPNADTLPWRGMGAGGGYSTVHDLLRFAHALMDGTLLPQSLASEATRSQNADGWYGYGFAQGGEGATRWFGHGGGAPGMNADWRVYPGTNTIMVTLSNLDPPTANALAEYYEARMPAGDADGE